MDPDPILEGIKRNSLLVNTAINFTIQKNKEDFKVVDKLLNDYMESNNLSYDDPITYYNFIEMSSIIDSATNKIYFKIIKEALTSILNDSVFEDSPDDD